ncbi:MAG: arsenate reductase (glutaredoxin) [Gammaproteobacteria bacterium]|nr:arsenate reductase (glutaredoxin) [Gammaproteobacteria bacterium]
MPVTLYHNPRCSKSRQTLALLQEHDVDVQIIEYLKTPPDETTLRDLLQRLELSVDELMRKGETEYREARSELDSMTEPQRVAWLAANPRVLQRPIVVSGDRARIGRPPEAVLEILDL